MCVAGVILASVIASSSEQMMTLIIEGVATPEEAQATFDEYVVRVCLIGAAVGIAVGAIAAWWFVRRVLRPIRELTDATRAIAAGDLRARVAGPAEEELRRLASAFNWMASSLERADELRTRLIEDVANELRTPLTSLAGTPRPSPMGSPSRRPRCFGRSMPRSRLTRLVEGLDQRPAAHMR